MVFGEVDIFAVSTFGFGCWTIPSFVTKMVAFEAWALVGVHSRCAEIVG